MRLRGVTGGVVLIGIKFFGGRVEENSLVYIKLVLLPLDRTIVLGERPKQSTRRAFITGGFERRFSIEGTQPAT
jgi:hypothetical protein